MAKISPKCHFWVSKMGTFGKSACFWARFWLNFNFGDFWAYFGYFSLVKIDFFEIYFQSWRIKLRVLKFFRPILIIKRHQKNTQAKLFEKFASRQHALLCNAHCVVHNITSGWRLHPNCNRRRRRYVQLYYTKKCRDFFQIYMRAKLRITLEPGPRLGHFF